MPPGNRLSRTSLINVRPMPMICEDEDQPVPALPPRSHRRNTWNAGETYLPSSYAKSAEGSIPVSHESDDSVPDRKSEPQKEGLASGLARRGGWYRLALMGLVFAGLVVALAVGLTIGLRKINASSDGTDAPLPQATLFPSGSYAFTVALSKTSSACSSNAATFNCFPYRTYAAADPPAASATFYWIIQPLNSYTYTISSSSNPFAPSFANVTMDLLDGNQFTERFVFNFTLSLPVIPKVDIVPGQRSAATCTFGSTVVRATLWTRMRAEYPANITAAPAPSAASTTFAPWPYHIEVDEVQAAGPGVPSCVDYQGRSLGDFAGTGTCGCWYSNFGLASGAAAVGDTTTSGSGNGNATASGSGSGNRNATSAVTARRWKG